MKIDICIPAFNEEKIIVEATGAVRDALGKIAGSEFRIIVADNGSTDKTAALAGKCEGVSVLSLSVRGKGAAVVAAAKASEADIFGFIDADLSADPRDITKILSPIARSECDISIGSRLIDKRTVRREWLRTLSSVLFNILRRAILGVSVADTQCGLKLMNGKGREVMRRCTERGWFFDMEFLARAERAGLALREIPINWDEHRFAGRASKLNLLRDSIGAVRAMIRIRRSVI